MHCADTVRFSGITHSAADDVDAFVEYSRIVGDDDGGTPFTPAQYEEYKKHVIPMRLNNRLYTSWTNHTGMDCKLIGPETPCFCKHRYKQHKTDLPSIPTTRPIAVLCCVRGCQCTTYRYIPLSGTQPLRCSGCKHFADEHSEKLPNPCSKGPQSMRVIDPDREERRSSRRRPGEDDMEYFERRYQERVRR